MVFLDRHLLIGKGEDRECYLHPEDPEKCVKTTYSGNPVQSHREREYYQALIKRNISFRRLSRFFGVIPTDKGDGYVFELIRDYDGKISSSLFNYLEGKSALLPFILFDLSDLKNYLLEEAIFLRDLNTGNLVYQRMNSQKGKLVIIDGVGNNEFIPFSNFSKFLSRKKILRKWDRFINKIDFRSLPGTEI